MFLEVENYSLSSSFKKTTEKTYLVFFRKTKVIFHCSLEQ